MYASTIVDREHASDSSSVAKIAQRLTIWGMMTKRQAAAFETETLANAPCDVTVSMRLRKKQALVVLEGATPRTCRITSTGDVLSADSWQHWRSGHCP